MNHPAGFARSRFAQRRDSSRCGRGLCNGAVKILYRVVVSLACML